MMEKENKTITALDRKGAKRIVHPLRRFLRIFYVHLSCDLPKDRQDGNVTLDKLLLGSMVQAGWFWSHEMPN